jgi:hypothetical protein
MAAPSSGLGHELSQIRSLAAPRAADGDFFLALCGASQQQVRVLRACDRSTSAGSEQQNDTGERPTLHARDDANAETVVRFGMVYGKIARSHPSPPLARPTLPDAIADDVEIAVVTPVGSRNSGIQKSTESLIPATLRL